MTADADDRVRACRRARVAIFGPLAAGAARRAARSSGGAIGFALSRRRHRAGGEPHTGATGRAGRRGAGDARCVHPRRRRRAALPARRPRPTPARDLDAGRRSRAAAPPKEPIVGAAGASTGGMWLATATGHVYASTAPSLGNATLEPERGADRRDRRGRRWPRVSPRRFRRSRLRLRREARRPVVGRAARARREAPTSSGSQPRRTAATGSRTATAR